MSWDQLREVADAGWEIGAHTCSHPFLTELGDAEVSRELREARAWCEEHMARSCPTLAYPYSDWNPRVAAAAGAAGYTGAVTVNTGTWNTPLQLPRTASTTTTRRLVCACGPSGGGSRGSMRC